VEAVRESARRASGIPGDGQHCQIAGSTVDHPTGSPACASTRCLSLGFLRSKHSWTVGRRVAAGTAPVACCAAMPASSPHQGSSSRCPRTSRRCQRTGDGPSALHQFITQVLAGLEGRPAVLIAGRPAETALRGTRPSGLSYGCDRMNYAPCLGSFSTYRRRG